MDSFDEKRGMVKKLLEMLKGHAANEVSNGLKKPDGEGDMHGLEVSHVEVLPDHKMDEATPEHDIREEEGQPDEASMHSGGVVEKVNASDPTPKIHSGPIPYESQSGSGKPEMEGAAHKDVMKEPLRGTTEERQEPMGTEYNDTDAEPPSMFASFLGKRKKK